MAAEDKIQLLKSQLREKEELLQKAAQAGLDLLNQNMELQTKMDEQRTEMTNALEVKKKILLIIPSQTLSQ